MEKPFFEAKDVWAPDDTYSNHRIPGIIITKRGTMLIYCEARRTASDWAMMDIMLQRSEDGGDSFGVPVLLAKGTEEHKTVNNPVMVEDMRGRIHFLYCEDYTINGGRLLHRFSDDDGLTWSEAEDITAVAFPEYHNAFALGPGHGIKAGDGTLVIPVWMVKRTEGAPLDAHSPSVVSTLYSTDNGDSWSLGEIIPDIDGVKNPNETVAAVTADGRVYLNMRMQGKCRAVAYSDNGYSGWCSYRADENLSDPQCFGSVLSYDDREHPYSLLFVNCDSTEKRENITVRVSTDNGKTYPISRTVDRERGGYVDIAADSNAKRIYVLYEDKYGITDHLAVFNYEWILSK